MPGKQEQLTVDTAEMILRVCRLSVPEFLALEEGEQAAFVAASQRIERERAGMIGRAVTDPVYAAALLGGEEAALETEDARRAHAALDQVRRLSA